MSDRFDCLWPFPACDNPPCWVIEIDAFYPKPGHIQKRLNVAQRLLQSGADVAISHFHRRMESFVTKPVDVNVVVPW